MIASLFLFCLADSLAAASPSFNEGSARSIPLARRDHAVIRSKTPANRAAWFKHQVDRLNAKYNTDQHASTKRASSATTQLTDLFVDLGYVAQISVGTPAKTYEVVLDTGSSDLWLASSTCQTGCSKVSDRYSASASSSFQDTQQPIDIQYGSGEVAGTIGTDTVTVSEFTVKAQSLGVMDQLSADVLSGDTSGLMGLAWRSLAQTGADPWWITLAKGGAWQQPLFSFYLARFSDKSGASDAESQGGNFDIGFTNKTVYTGDIDYVSLTSQNYWLIPLKSIVVGGKTISIGTQAAIDTGTSLIGGPSSVIDQIYAQIPGAQKGTGAVSEYYIYPCSTNVDVSMAFGTKTWRIHSADMSIPFDGTNCIGAFFSLTISAGGTGLQWVVGDAFLKNVYSIFRYDPPAVGFASLAPAFGGSTAGSSSSAAATPTITRVVPTSASVSDLPTSSISNTPTSLSASLVSTAIVPGPTTVILGTSISSASTITTIRSVESTISTVSSATGSSASANESAGTTSRSSANGVGTPVQVSSTISLSSLSGVQSPAASPTSAQSNAREGSIPSYAGGLLGGMSMVAYILICL